jgi:hypothetical protein
LLSFPASFCLKFPSAQLLACVFNLFLIVTSIYGLFDVTSLPVCTP